MERFLSILISLFLLSTSQAATITIGPARGGNYDYNRIQSGIDAANNGESNRRLQVTSWRELNHSFFLTGKAIALNRNKIDHGVGLQVPPLPYKLGNSVGVLRYPYSILSHILNTPDAGCLILSQGKLGLLMI